MVALRAAFALPLLAVALFSFSLAGPFHLDDYALFNDPLITSGDGWWRMWRIEQTRPLTWLSFWISYQLFGSEPWAWHGVNVLLHAVAVYLVFDVLSRLIPRPAAIAAAAIFAVHPIQTEAVAYVYARSSQLAAIFSLLAIRSWIQGRHWHAVLWFIPALLSKEECIALPVFLALLHLSVSRNRRELRPIGAMLGLSILAGLRLLFAASVTPGAGVGPSAGYSPIEYFAAQGGVMVRYALLLAGAFPFFTVDPPPPPVWLHWVGWLVPIALSIAALRHFHRAGWGFWFVGGLVLLLPSTSVFPAADLAADRRLYLPMLGFSAAAALVLPRVPKIAVVTVFALLTIHRIYVWNSEERLWREAVDRAPAKLRPRIQLARALPPDESVAVLLEAKNFAADDAVLASELGRTYLQLSQPVQALQEFGRALAAEPGNPQHVVNRGVVLAALNQREAAVAEFHRALRLKPCMPEAVANLTKLGESTPECRR